MNPFYRILKHASSNQHFPIKAACIVIVLVTTFVKDGTVFGLKNMQIPIKNDARPRTNDSFSSDSAEVI